jgi:hypothetical protein
LTAAYELGELVAERHLEATGPHGKSDVTLKIGRPFRDHLPGGDWGCTFQIVGLGDDAALAAFGVDALQALLLAVYGSQLHLEERAAAAAVRLTWLGQPDLGLKVDPEVHKLIAAAPGNGV